MSASSTETVLEFAYSHQSLRPGKMDGDNEKKRSGNSSFISEESPHKKISTCKSSGTSCCSGHEHGHTSNCGLTASLSSRNIFGAMLSAQKRRRCARDVSEYKIVESVGEGAYGFVWKAFDPQTGEEVALKMIKTGSDSGAPDTELGFPITSIREIRILKALQHENIVGLKDVVTDMDGRMKKGKKGGVYMVFEYLDADLEGILKTRDVRLSPCHIKSFMHQLLQGMEYMHRNKVVHRDLKGANLLISSNNSLKIADFGLARSIHDNLKVMTSKVITLWYRPPELLMRGTKYGTSIDMWSVGCIFGELLKGSALIPGKDERDQMEQIFNLRGTPTPQSWPEVVHLPDWEPYWKNICIQNPRRAVLPKEFQNLDRNTLDLLNQLLQLDPSKRITASKALNHDYFFDSPKLQDPKHLPRLNFRSCHELDAKKRHQQEKAARMKQQEQERLKFESMKQAEKVMKAREIVSNRSNNKYYDHMKKPISKESKGW